MAWYDQYLNLNTIVPPYRPVNPPQGLAFAGRVGQDLIPQDSPWRGLFERAALGRRLRQQGYGFQRNPLNPFDMTRGFGVPRPPPIWQMNVLPGSVRTNVNRPTVTPSRQSAVDYQQTKNEALVPVRRDTQPVANPDMYGPRRAANLNRYYGSSY